MCTQTRHRSIIHSRHTQGLERNTKGSNVPLTQKTSFWKMGWGFGNADIYRQSMLTWFRVIQFSEVILFQDLLESTQRESRNSIPLMLWWTSLENVRLNVNVLLFGLNNLMKLCLKWSALAQGCQNQSIRLTACCDSRGLCLDPLYWVCLCDPLGPSGLYGLLSFCHLFPHWWMPKKDEATSWLRLFP